MEKALRVFKLNILLETIHYYKTALKYFNKLWKITMILPTVFVAVLSLASALSSVTIDQEWLKFQTKFKRSYKNVHELENRKKLFTKNLEEIWKHNDEYRIGHQSYTKGVNQFTDMTSEEVEASMLGIHGAFLRNIRFEKNVQADFTRFDNESIPESIDYRKLGAVTKVKSQKACGSCWAFAAISPLESQYFLATKKLVSLSEQQLVDCSSSNDGCYGGYMTSAFADLKQIGGVAESKSYPYVATQNKCKFNTSMAVMQVTGYKTVKQFDEEALKKAVALFGPISVGVQATYNFLAYYKGIFYDHLCANNDPYNLNHGVVVVGYGSENGKDYWLVRNSWGNTWGDDGYIKMIRNRNNHCQIASLAAYPEVKVIKE